MASRVTSMGMRAGLHTLRVVAGSPALDRLGLRGPAERALTAVTRETVRTFTRVPGIGKPVRQWPAREPELFDLTPTDEQAMLVDALRDFATKLRGLAKDADAACGAEIEDEVGIALLGVPEALGGLTEERSTVTGVLAAEALGHGDVGLAVSLLAPAGVAAAISRFGDASQQATYLPFRARAGRLALLEPGPLFDPFELETTARNGRISGEKALVPLGATADLLLVAAATEDGPAVFIVEQWDARPEPAMGLRAAATARITLSDVPGERLCGRAGIRRARRPRAARVVRAGGRRRTRRARLRDPLRQRAARVRRADLAPPGRRLHGRRHRDRGRGAAAAHAARGDTDRPRRGRGPRRRARRAGSRPTRPWRSARTASSCSAATAT